MLGKTQLPAAAIVKIISFTGKLRDSSAQRQPFGPCVLTAISQKTDTVESPTCQLLSPQGVRFRNFTEMDAQAYQEQPVHGQTPLRCSTDQLVFIDRCLLSKEPLE